MAMVQADPQPDQHRELVDQLDERVRDLVRGEGVDPQRDAVVVRRIAESVVRDHDERSLTGAVVPVPDVGSMVGELVARVSGFGPLQPFLDDPAVEESRIAPRCQRRRRRFPSRSVRMADVAGPDWMPVEKRGNTVGCANLHATSSANQHPGAVEARSSEEAMTASA